MTDEPRLPSVDRWFVVAAFAFALAAYLATAARGIAAEGDCAQYVVAARVAGIPHPPGAPTYMLLAAGLGRIVPAGHLAAVLNGTSAFFGALTVALVVLASLRLVRQTLPGASAGVARGAALLSGAALATATEFWNQALIAEVYAPSTALLAFCLERWCARPTPGRRWTMALAAGLAFGVHYSVAAPCTLLAGLAAWEARRALGPRGLARLGAAFLFGLTTFLYLPLRSLSDPPLDFGDPETPARFWRVVTLADMATGRVVARELALLRGQIGAVAGLARDQWPPWVLALALAGLAAGLARRSMRRSTCTLATLLALAYGGILAMANFPLVEERVYELRFLFLPAYLALALAFGSGCALAASGLGARWRLAGLVLVGALALGLVPWATAQARRLDRSSDHVLEDYGRALLAATEEPALLFVYGDNAWMPLTYLQVVERDPRDVRIVVAPRLGLPWYHRELAERHPELAQDPSAPGVAGMARVNAARFNLYHTDPKMRAIRGFAELPAGVLTRLVPEGVVAEPAVPPAPMFTPGYAVLDRRARSIRAEVVQAYARAGAWLRAEGRAPDAERAYREGLALVTPEPAMEEFESARAALAVALGDLLAGLGRATEAHAIWTEVRARSPSSPAGRRAARRLAGVDDGGEVVGESGTGAEAP
jgi:hypothetical protein